MLSLLAAGCSTVSLAGNVTAWTQDRLDFPAALGVFHYSHTIITPKSDFVFAETA